MSLFEERTEEALLDEALAAAPEDIDTREGSVYYDSIAGTVQHEAELFADAALIAEQSSFKTATGEFLDLLADNLYIARLQREKAQTATYKLNLTAASGALLEELDIEDGDRYIVNELYFLLRIDDNDSYYLEAEEGGADFNNITAGTMAVPVETVDYLESATVGLQIRPGIEEESDDDFRARIQEALSAPTENANKQQYKTWCEDIEGVGTATIYPLFAGPNTVKAVLVDSNNQPCTAENVAKVQEYIDPITRNTTVTVDGVEIVIGDGIGEGKAPLGAHFLAVSAVNYNITVKIVNLSYVSESESETIINKIKRQIESYFSILTKNSNGTESIEVKLVKVSSLIASVDGVDDFDTVLLNNNENNITVPAGEIPHLLEIIST